MAEMRPFIIKLHEKGYSTREIEQLPDVSQSSVSRHIKRYEETGNHKDREGRGRKKTVRSKRNMPMMAILNKSSCYHCYLLF